MLVAFLEHDYRSIRAKWSEKAEQMQEVVALNDNRTWTPQDPMTTHHTVSFHSFDDVRLKRPP